MRLVSTICNISSSGNILHIQVKSELCESKINKIELILVNPNHCPALVADEGTSPPLSLVQEVQGSQQVKAMEVIVDAKLQEVVLRQVEQILENITNKHHLKEIRHRVLF